MNPVVCQVATNSTMLFGVSAGLNNIMNNENIITNTTMNGTANYSAMYNVIQFYTPYNSTNYITV